MLLRLCGRDRAVGVYIFCVGRVVVVVCVRRVSVGVEMNGVGVLDLTRSVVEGMWLCCWNMGGELGGDRGVEEYVCSGSWCCRRGRKSRERWVV